MSTFLKLVFARFIYVGVEFVGRCEWILALKM